MSAGYPPLGIMTAALPLLALDVRAADPRPGEGLWGWANRFVHVENQAGPLIAWSRAPVVAATLALALLVSWWARQVSGPLAGLVALGLLAFHPSLLAHGHLNTTDMPATASMVAASWAFWKWSQSPRLLWSGLVALTVGIAVTVRLTGWLIVPVFLVLAALRTFAAASKRDALLEALRLVVVGVTVVMLAIWAVYGFHYAPWPGASVAQAPGPWLGAAGRLIARLEAWRLLPEAYLEALRFQVEHSVVGHPAYLEGRVSNTGWPQYYLVAFAVKNTPGFLLAAAVALLALIRGGNRALRGGVEAHWILPAAVMFVAASAGRIQIGERYILPVYPYLMLLAASAAPVLQRKRWAPVAGAAVLALHVVPCALSMPRGYLTYFNLLAGGTDGGHRLLLDSNLDWGQDLPRLARWMKTNHIESVQLGYHGSDDPGRLGIQHEDLPGLHVYPPTPAQVPFKGVVAVSPNLLMGIFYPPGENPYAALVNRPPAARAGGLFIFML